MVNVSLAFDPSGPFRVSIGALDTGTASVSATVIDFDASNWDVPRPITVLAVQDDDVADDSTVVRATASGVSPAEVTDDDDQAIVAEQSLLAVDEGASVNLGVRLAFRPSSPVTISVTSSAGATATPSMMVVTAAEDDADNSDETATITVSVANGPSAEVTVNVIDDERQSLVVTPTNFNLEEEAGGETFEVSLAFPPQGSVTVNLVSSDAQRLPLSVNSLTFGPSTSPQGPPRSSWTAR